MLGYNPVVKYQNSLTMFRGKHEMTEQLKLLDVPPVWAKEWVDMPTFCLPDYKYVNDKFNEIRHNRYPIFVISKGRWENALTAKALDLMGVDYHIVVENKEYEKYLEQIGDKNKILVLPFDNLGLGSIPARNKVFEYSVKIGAKKHWILDDNIGGFGTVVDGKRIKTNNPSFFRTCEDFTDRYKNIALSGIRYRFHHHFVRAPYLLNTRIYSCILINNEIPYRWRGRYNEDTDLSLRALKDGWCTLLFTWCYCDKTATMKMKGGNTDELYKQDETFDGRYEMARSLKEQHPDCVTITRKWNRWQHSVDYRRFKKNILLPL